MSGGGIACRHDNPGLLFVIASEINDGNDPLNTMSGGIGVITPERR